MQKQQPLVSIVTPSYNQVQYLEETILSILNQDYPNIEYIIIDGGSTDGSIEIIKKYADRLAYWVSESDRGQSHAINKGWARATGEIVAYLNSDDVYTPGAIRAAVQALQANPQTCMVYSDALAVNERSTVTRGLKSQPFDVKRLILEDSYIPQPTVFMRRHALNTVGLLDERLHMVMDYDLWVRLGLEYSAIYLSGVNLALVREHAAAKSTAKMDKFPVERRRIMNKVFVQSEPPLVVKGLRRSAFSAASFNQASLAARLQQPRHIMQPLLRATWESPSYVAGRPLDCIYLAMRAIFPWWTGMNGHLPS